MKDREKSPAEKIVDWWGTDEPVEALEVALDELATRSKTGEADVSLEDAFVLPFHAQNTPSALRPWITAANLLLRVVLVVVIGFLGWGLWRLSTGFVEQSFDPLSRQLGQTQGKMDDLAARVATVEAGQPAVAAMGTLQAQVGRLQQALTTSPVHTLTPTPVTPTITPSTTPTAIPTVATMPGAPATLSLSGPEGRYQGTVIPRTGPGFGNDEKGIYDQHGTIQQKGNTVIVLGKWLQGDWLFVRTDVPTVAFFWIANDVEYKEEAPAIAMPWWRPTPALSPWKEAEIDGLSVYSMTLVVSDAISLTVPWVFQVHQDGEYVLEAWMPSLSEATLTYQFERQGISSEAGEPPPRTVDQSMLQGKPGFHPLERVKLNKGTTLKVSVVTARRGSRAQGTGAVAAIGPLRLVRQK